MNKRTFLTFSLLAAIFSFGLVRMVVLFGYALPRPNWVNVGPVANYPPSDVPYFVRGNKPVFVVNTGEKMLVLVAMPPHPKSCLA